MELEYKATFRFPTEQFAYIEVEAQGTPGSLVEQYNAFGRLLKVGDGITDKEFDQFIEKQLSGETNMLKTYQRMSPSQQQIAQINKRAIRRIKAKIK